MMVNKKSSIRKKSQGDYQKGYVSSAKRGLKGKLFLALAVLMLCACSSDDELESTFSGANATGSVAYLTINLRDVNASTRATSDGGFASGTEAEQKVANAYFYFYDDNGNYIASGNVGSTTGTASTSTTGDIEWNSATVVAVWGLEPDNEGNLPTKMLTVINQPSSFNITGKTLSEATKTLAGTPYADASGNFVMSTSVYYSSGIVNTTTLKASDFKEEPIDVTTDYPSGGVDVYVERLAAKVDVNLDESLTQPISISITNAGSTSLESGVYVQLLGWNVDCVARDAYMVKNIDDNANWGGFYFVWNASSNFRTYWGESPNYDDNTVTYPTTSKGNTATQENSDSTWLNKYLRYVDLNEPVEFGQTTYCGENTNTATVLQDATSTALTNVIVKAQAGTLEENTFTPIDLVECGGYYYTVDDFCQTYVYKNFASTIGNAITALESEYSELTTELEALISAVAGGSVYKTSKSDETPTATTSFGGEMLSLYNACDGNVTIGYNTSSTIDNIVYSGLDLDAYNFWFSVDASALTDAISDLINASLLVQIGSDYYIPLNANIEFTEQGVSYSMRSYFLSALASDAATTNAQFATASNYPNYYNGGMMYYSVPIEHLGLSTTTTHNFSTGDYGVVRNHWYDITINSIASMGRGIAQPTEVIVPIGDNGIQTTAIGTSTKIDSWKEYDQMVIF